MKAGCYLTLALLTALILGAHSYLSQFFKPQEAWIGAAIWGCATWLCIGSFWNGLLLGSTLRALRNAREGVAPIDGEMSAVAGRLEPYKDPVIAPFSQQPCVIYEYEISRRISNQKQSQNQIDFSGMGMAACQVAGAEQTVALLGYPDLEAFPQKNCGPGSRERAQEYVRHTEWEDLTGLKILSGFNKYLRDLTSREETLRQDFRSISISKCPWFARPEETEQDYQRRVNASNYHPRLSERVLTAGRPVVAIGIYDAAGEALLPQRGTNFRFLKILPGSLDEEYQRTRTARRQYFLGGLIGLIVINGVAALLLRTMQ